MLYPPPADLVAHLEAAVATWPGNPLFGTKDAEGVYQWVTYSQVGERVDHLRGGLAALGISRGDAVAYIGDNSTEWAVAAFATYGRAARFVPMYERELERIWRHIVEDSGAKLLFVANEAILEQVRAWPDEIEALEHLVLLAGEGEGTLAALEVAGAANPVEAIHPDPSEIAVLIYTSGTTAAPKGVLLTHDNLVRNARGGGSLFTDFLDEGSVSLSILPWAHSYGQVADLYNFMQFGASVAFMESVATLADDMMAVRPTFLIAVPRIFSRIHAGLWKKMEERGGVAWLLFRKGTAAAARVREGGAGAADRVWLALAERVIFPKIRERFGGRLIGSLTGSATMNPEIMFFFRDLGIPCFDAYGLTETSPAATMNCPAAWRAGSVGRAIDGVRVEIDASGTEPGSDEGEIIVYGHNVMAGYHNLPEQTAAVMTEDGGFRTGDRGRVDADGFLFITGRIKEQYKLENGKYVFPASIEEAINLSPWVTSSMLFGVGRPHNVALVVPDPEVLLPWAREQGLTGDLEALVAEPAVAEHLLGAVREALEGQVASYEMPRGVVVLSADFSTEDGTLTQTLKLKRRVVVERYQGRIDTAYG